jgi:hypothetical protein
MRCNQELYGHINCDRDVIEGEKFCKFHFVPSLRKKIQELEAQNEIMREALTSIAFLDEPEADRSEYWLLISKLATSKLHDTMATDTAISREALKKIGV